jgi:hypothetical protein
MIRSFDVVESALAAVSDGAAEHETGKHCKMKNEK